MRQNGIKSGIIDKWFNDNKYTKKDEENEEDFSN